MTPVDAVLFDLDGTLIDSIDLIAQSGRHAFTVCGEAVPPDAEWLADLGRPLRAMFARFGASGDRLERLVAGYREFQHAHHDRLIQPYPDVARTLDRLAEAGLRLAIVTSKGEPMARRGLAQMGLEHRFETVVGLESCTRHKPDPEPVRTALNRLDVAPDRAVFIGDSPFDMLAGRAAGVRTGAALWGPFTRAQLEPTAPDWWLRTIGELLPALGIE